MQTRTAARLALAACLLTSTACGTLSVKEEKQLGHQVQRQVREQFTLMRDRVVVNYVRSIGEDLVKAADMALLEAKKRGNKVCAWG